MGRSNRDYHRATTKSYTLPSSPTHSSSSFEFTISLSPHKSSAALCPADELFYKGQLLPLHLSPRLSMVRTLLLSSSSSDTTTTASRDSTASDSSRPSSVTDEELKRLYTTANNNDILSGKSSKYFSLPKFSSVFRKENKKTTPPGGGAAMKRMSCGAKEVLRKYLKRVKPLYEKLSQKRPAPQRSPPPPPSSRGSRSTNTTMYVKKDRDEEFMKGVYYSNRNIPQSFSGNLRCPKRRSYIASCPSSMMPSPRHDDSGLGLTQIGPVGPGSCKSDVSSMEELQRAIQGAIAHCKNSMKKNIDTVSNENRDIKKEEEENLCRIIN